MLQIGDTANNITLKGLTKENHLADISLSDFHGKNIVLLFYSMQKALEGNENSKRFDDVFNMLHSAIIILVNKEPLEEQAKLKKHSNLLNFIFLTDPTERVAKIFDAENDNNLTSKSSLFVLNGDLKIMNLWRQTEHMGTVADEIAKYLNEKM